MSISEPDTDAVAREAARLYDSGSVERLEDAVESALSALNADGAVRPKLGRVRQHLQAMTMQRLGEAGYRAQIRDRLGGIEELMTAIRQMFDDVEPILMGRAARGQLDGTSRVHLRLYTERTTDELATCLEELDYTDVTISTVNTRFGRLNRLTVLDDGLEIVMTRCASDRRDGLGRDLFTGQPVAWADVDAVRTLLAAISPG